MRCFVAIPIPESTLDRLERLQNDIPAGRTLPRENLHLTVTFLGELTEPEVSAVHDGLSEIHPPAFQLEFSGLDMFGGKRPQILFAAIRPAEGLLALQKKVVRAARDAGVDLRRERYRPHVTLARFNRSLQGAEEDRLGGFLQANGAFSSEPFEAQSFCLFRSDLGHGSARHTEMARYPLIPGTQN